jgi:hypothetical protein
MDIPDNKVFKVLEYRKDYLIKQNENTGGKNGYIQKEIKSLTKIMDFTKLILNTLPNELIRKTISEYDLENKNAENEQPEPAEDETIYTYEKHATANDKLRISFMQNKDSPYIKLESQKYVKNKFKWENRGKYYMSPAMLEEILQKSNELGIR